jgi:xylose dehydrogenase (NAD/NADP)
MANPIRWGVISTSGIARDEVIPAIKQSRNGKVMAVASRDRDRARKYADALGIEKAYGSYDELLADSNIDAIYNPLPNDGHVPWSIAAAKAHKPTLCEKPIALDAKQAQQLVEAFHKENVLLAEAFMYRYHPQHEHARQLLKENWIGPLQLINNSFTYSLPTSDTTNVRLQPELGGGGLMDVGCYCVNLCRTVTGEEPDQVTGQVVYGKASKVDEAFVGTLHFPSGVLAHFDCGMRAMFRDEYTLVCQNGTVKSTKAFRPVDNAEATLELRRGRDECESIIIPPCNQYTLMVEDFADAVQQGRKVTYDPTHSVGNMRVLDALAHAAREGVVVRL